MDPGCAVDENMAPLIHGLQGRVNAFAERTQRDWYQRGIEGGQPQAFHGRVMGIWIGPAFKPHVNDQGHAQRPQLIIIVWFRGRADEQVLCDLRYIHR